MRPSGKRNIPPIYIARVGGSFQPSMKFIPLIWKNIWRRRFRTTFTLLSIFVAFLLFGILMTFRAAFTLGVDVAGLEVEALYGWFDRRPFGEDSAEYVFVARKPEGIVMSSNPDAARRQQMPLEAEASPLASASPPIVRSTSW